MYRIWKDIGFKKTNWNRIDYFQFRIWSWIGNFMNWKEKIMDEELNEIKKFNK